MRSSHGGFPHGKRPASSCRLCTGITADQPRELWNQPLLESEHFVAIPSLGALVEGWLLIVPKGHFISAAALPDDLAGEMAEFKQDVCRIVRRYYGSPSVFEHGPATACHTTGCSVDHAHIHVVPVETDLSRPAQVFLPPGVEFRPGTMADCRLAAKRGADYLYLEQPVGVRVVAVHDQFASQVFRRAIAAVLGVPEAYDWRDHPQLLKVVATAARLRQAAANDLTHPYASLAAAL